MNKLSNLAKSDGIRYSKMALDQSYLIVNLKMVDSNGDIEVSREIMEICLNECKSKAPYCAFLLITSCEKETKVLVYDPHPNPRASEWLNNTSMKTNENGNSLVYVVKEMQEGQYYKFRDQVIDEAFLWLKNNGFMDEESDEEIYEF